MNVQQELQNFSMFQQLHKQELIGIQRLVADSPVFHKWLEMTAEFKLIATELKVYEQIVPFEASYENNNRHVTQTEGNVIFVDFNHRTQFAPYIILLNNVYESSFHLEKLKAHLFPLLELCSIQKRDCRIVLATGESIDFPCGQVGTRQLNAFFSIKGRNAKQLITMDLKSAFLHIEHSRLPFGEILIASSQPLRISGIDVKADVVLSAMFLNEDVFENSILPVIEKVYFIEEAE